MLRLGSDQPVDKYVILKTCLEPARMKELISISDFKHRTNFKKNHIAPLVSKGLFAFTVPDKPNIPNYRYVTTKKGRNVLSRKKMVIYLYYTFFEALTAILAMADATTFYVCGIYFLLQQETDS